MHRILVIDDELDVRDGIKRVLDRAGFSVRTVDNATDAMLELRRLAADVVITDIIMPRVNGVAAIECIVREFPKVRIVAISGGGNFDVTVRAFGNREALVDCPPDGGAARRSVGEDSRHFARTALATPTSAPSGAAKRSSASMPSRWATG